MREPGSRNRVPARPACRSASALRCSGVSGGLCACGTATGHRDRTSRVHVNTYNHHGCCININTENRPYPGVKIGCYYSGPGEVLLRCYYGVTTLVVTPGVTTLKSGKSSYFHRI